MDIARLLVQVEANTAQAEAGLAALHKSVALAAIGFGVIVVAAAAVGVASLKMASDFQAGLTSLVTGAGESANNIKLVHDGILKLAKDTGTSTKQLTDGMFMIESAGFHGQAGLDVLKAAAMGAKVGVADLGVVADATTTIMKDYPSVLNGASGAVNYLVATVANGKTHMQDLAQSLAMVLPTASAARVGLGDVMGAMATMTGMGVPAANAATYLRQTILSLVAPSSAAKAMLASVGLTTADVAKALQDPKIGLSGTLAMITDHLKTKFPEGSAAYMAAIKDIAGGSKTMQGMLDLTGAHAKDFANNVKNISAQVKSGGTHIQGWTDVQKDLNFQVSRAKEQVEAFFISLGEKLLPKVTEITKYLVDHAGPAIQGLTKFWTDHKAIIVIAALVIGGALVAAFVAWTVSAAAAAVATIAATWPILLIGAAIALLVAGVIWAYQNWGWFREAVRLAGIGLGVLKDELGHVFEFLGHVKDRIGDLLGLLGKFKDAAGNALSKVAPILGLHLPGHAEGTQYTAGGAFAGAERGPELLLTPGVYTAPRGSTVLNAQDTARVMQSAGGGKNSGQTINIYPQKADLDEDDLARHLRRVALLANTSGGY